MHKLNTSSSVKHTPSLAHHIELRWFRRIWTHLLVSEFASYLPCSVVRIQVDVVVRIGISATASYDVNTGQDGGHKGTLHESVHDTCCSGESYTWRRLCGMREREWMERDEKVGLWE